MAGGIGSRFWPWSRKENPKQFLDILGTGKSLIRQTFERFEEFIPAENIYVVTNTDYKGLVFEHLPELKEGQVLCEPVMRNTAPCIAYASYKINKINPNANIVVAPSDHLISNTLEFKNRITEGFEVISKGDLLTLGIAPSRPDTGYGYIEYDKDVNANLVKTVSQFREKPDKQTAIEFIKKGNFVWNAGIFMWSAKSIIHEMETHLPQISQVFKDGLDSLNTSKEVDFINQNFPKCDNISIDYGIMESAENIKVMLCDFGWSDLGTWGSLYDNLSKDESNNATLGDNFFINETSNSLIKSDKNKKIVIHGLTDLIVVDSGDELLICNKNDEQKIKGLVSKLNE
ncbi:MAG: mannose-1-phosphate guanylyltransferase [Salibacteraceae bacterium]